MFEDLNNVHKIAIHLSAPLSTIAFYHTVHYEDFLNGSKCVPSFSKGRITVFTYNTEYINKILENITKFVNIEKCKQIEITYYGDNLQKYIKEVQETLPMRFLEFRNYKDCTTKGSNFLMKNVLHEVYEYEGHEKLKFLEHNDPLKPYVLVLINHKIVFIKVEIDNTCEIIHESAFDYGLLLKIANSVYGIKSLEEFFDFISKHYNFGEKEFTSEGTSNDNNNLALVLLQKMLQNLCDIIVLQLQKHDINNVVFGEYFYNEIFLNEILKCFKKYSKLDKNVYFMRHTNISTALGALLTEIPDIDCKNSWWENVALSSGLVVEEKIEDYFLSKLILENLNAELVVFPLLKDPKLYLPFTQNFYAAKEKRDYWINRIDEILKFHMEKKKHENPTYATCCQLSSEKLAYLKRHHLAYGALNFGTLQTILTQFKYSFGMLDIFYETKRKEVDMALNNLSEWFKYLDDLPSEKRHKELAKSMLAGNVFDWASIETYRMISSKAFDFNAALEKVPDRPWTVDDLDAWIERMNGPAHKLAAIFPDNCGFDFISGVIPFARELIKRGTKVIFCTNVEPVVNDVTCYEAKEILEKISFFCPIIESAYRENKINILKHSKSSTCIDFRFIDKDLAEICNDIDLIVLDGMGRAGHSNFYADFKVESLKAAVIKDAGLSQDFGGKEMSFVFKYSKMS